MSRAGIAPDAAERVDGARGAPPVHLHGGDDELAAVVRRLLELLGEDPGREGLLGTPGRVARSLRRLTDGYARTAEGAVGDALFEAGGHGLVLVRDIEFHSLCEHHLLPFQGRVHVGYVPDGRVVGLSKVARVVEVYARRLQLQERLTAQVADALVSVLRPRGVAVAVEATHLCMAMRGVEKAHASTFTREYRGGFLECAELREEFGRVALGR